MDGGRTWTAMDREFGSEEREAVTVGILGERMVLFVLIGET